MSMWKLSNILAGAASVQLFGPRTDYRHIIAEVRARAAAEGADVDAVFKQYLRERRLGQWLLTSASLLAMAAAAVGAARGWPDLLVGPLALAPSALMLVVQALHVHDQDIAAQ